MNFVQLASVLIARYYGLVQIEDLNLNGSAYYPEIVAGLVDRYGFVKYPTKPEDFDEGKGIEFANGRAGKQVIDKLIILNSGIYLDTPINTDASKALWFDLMNWATGQFGLTFEPQMVKRSVYVSSITFYSDAPIIAVHPVFSAIADEVSKGLERDYGSSLNYDVSSVAVGYDPLTIKIGPAPFMIQRREGAPYSENKYFSTAPAATNIHIRWIEQIEQAVTRRWN